MTPKIAAENMTEAVSYLIAVARNNEMETIAEQLTQVRAKLVMQSDTLTAGASQTKRSLQQQRLSTKECD